MDEIIRDSNGSIINTGDKVKFLSKIDMVTKIGTIIKIGDELISIKDKDNTTLYKYREVDKYMIRKI